MNRKWKPKTWVKRALNMLKKLGENSDQIANSLRAQYIKGGYCFYNCPIYHYLNPNKPYMNDDRAYSMMHLSQEDIRDLPKDTEYEVIVSSYMLRLVIAGNPFLIVSEFPLPRAIQQFVFDYDRGMYRFLYIENEAESNRLTIVE